MTQHTQPTFRFENRSNNEKIAIYPADDEDKIAVIEHEYDGIPAQGVVRHDVTDITVSDAEFPEDDNDDAEILDEYRAEVREFVEKVLLTRSSLGFSEISVSREGKHVYHIKEHTDGEEYVVELETCNRRRIE